MKLVVVSKAEGENQKRRMIAKLTWNNNFGQSRDNHGVGLSLEDGVVFGHEDGQGV